MEMLLRDEVFKEVERESSTKFAERLFSYIKREYHYNPGEIGDACPDFYNSLDELISQGGDVKEAMALADEHFGQMYFERKKRIVGAL